MTTTTLPTFAATSQWQDIVATNASASGVDVELQNTGDSDIEVVAKASGGAPTSGGMIFRPREGFTFNNAQIWVRSLSGRAGRVSLLIL